MHHAFSIPYCLWCNSHYYRQGILLNSFILPSSSLVVCKLSVFLEVMDQLVMLPTNAPFNELE